MKVTSGKQGLEKAVKISKKLRRERNALEEFINSVDKDLSERESVKAPRDMEEELKWIKVSV